MKIGVQTWGSHGDVRPLLALAHGLQDAGHQVTIVVTSLSYGFYQSQECENGLKIIVRDANIAGGIEYIKKIEESIQSTASPLTQAKLIIEELFLPAEEDMYTMAEYLCAENDIVIGHHLSYPLHTAAELSNTPYVSVMCALKLIPSKHYPPHGLPNISKMLNKLSWKVVQYLINRYIKPYTDLLRAKKNLPPIKDLIEQVYCSQQLTLVANSAELCETSSDWPKHIISCGFFDMPNLNVEGALSCALQQFLTNGSAPVYITFGSWSANPNEPGFERTLNMLIDAIKQAGVRAIIQVDEPDLISRDDVDEFFFVSATPYTQVFPHCSLIIHHGGSGTAQSVLLSGKPSITVAHFVEHEAWGDKFQNLGIGKVINRRNLSQAKLTSLIKDVLHNPKYTTNAQNIAQQMQGEFGVDKAVKCINQNFIDS